MSEAKSKSQSQGYEKSWIRMITRLHQKKRFPPELAKDVFEKVVDLSEKIEETWSEKVEGFQNEMFTGEFILRYADSQCTDKQRSRVAKLLDKMGKTESGHHTVEDFVQGIRGGFVFKELSSVEIPGEAEDGIEWEFEYAHGEPEEKEGRLFRWIVLKVGPGSKVRLLYCDSSEIQRSADKEDSDKKHEDEDDLNVIASDMMRDRQEGRDERDALANWVHRKLKENAGRMMETKYLGSQWIKEGRGETSAKKISMSNGCRNFGEFIDKFVTGLAIESNETIHCHHRNTVQQRFGINVGVAIQEDLDNRIKSWLINDREVPIGDPKTAASIFTEICVELRKVGKRLEEEQNILTAYEPIRIKSEDKVRILNEVVDSLVPKFGEKHKGFIWRSSLSPLHGIMRRKRISGSRTLRDNCTHFIDKAPDEFDYDSVWDVVMDWKREVEEYIPEWERMLEVMSSRSYFYPTKNIKTSRGNRKMPTKKFQTVRGRPKRNTGESTGQPEAELEEE